MKIPLRIFLFCMTSTSVFPLRIGFANEAFDFVPDSIARMEIYNDIRNHIKYISFCTRAWIKGRSREISALIKTDPLSPPPGYDPWFILVFAEDQSQSIASNLSEKLDENTQKSLNSFLYQDAQPLKGTLSDPGSKNEMRIYPMDQNGLYRVELRVGKKVVGWSLKPSLNEAVQGAFRMNQARKSLVRIRKTKHPFDQAVQEAIDFFGHKAIYAMLPITDGFFQGLCNAKDETESVASEEAKKDAKVNNFGSLYKQLGSEYLSYCAKVASGNEKEKTVFHKLEEEMKASVTSSTSSSAQ